MPGSPHAPVPFDPAGLHGASAAPETVTEQPDLSFEHHPEAKWIGADPLGLRLLAVALVRRARRRRGEATTPIPWFAIAVTVGLVVLLGALVWAAVGVIG